MMKLRTFLGRLGLIFVILGTGFLLGCAKEADPDVLTGIFAPVLEDCKANSAVMAMENGYHYAVYDVRGVDVPGFHKTTTDGPLPEERVTFAIVETDGTGTPVKMIPVEAELTYGSVMTAGERGLYFLTEEQGKPMLLLVGWDGCTVARANCAELRPEGESATPFPHFLYEQYSLTERGEGIALIWGSTCLLLDETLGKIGEIPLPGRGEQVFDDNGTLWVAYQEGTARTIAQVTDEGLGEQRSLPEGFQAGSNMQWTRLMDCEDGWLYGWSPAAGVIRWQIGGKEENMETVMDFFNSSIPGQNVNTVLRYPNGLYYVGVRTENGLGQRANLYRSAPEKRLSEMNVLTVACAMPYRGLEEEIFAYNAAHPETYVRLVSYERYNTINDHREGKKRLMLDLSTGLLKPDVLVDTVFQPMDLYPLMTGEVKKEDIAPCVRNQFETEGKLDRISNQFSIYGLVGRQDVIGDRDGWTMEEFLDFAEGLTAGEYLMEKVSRSSSYQKLFGRRAYEPFLGENTADFETSLYFRYLELIKSLPEEEETYMDHGANNYGDLMAGTILPEQLEYSKGGENLYYNGDIKLMYAMAMDSLYELVEMVGTLGTKEVSMVGFPSEADGGMTVLLSGGTFSIPATCKNPTLAWAFVEELLFAEQFDAEPEETTQRNMRNNTFWTLYRHSLAWFEAMKGVKIFLPYGDPGSSYIGYQLSLDENGLFKGMPGQLITWDDEMIGLVKELMEHAGSGSDPIDGAIRDIAWEEETRYLAGIISAEECGRIVERRVRLWLAENSDS